MISALYTLFFFGKPLIRLSQAQAPEYSSMLESLKKSQADLAQRMSPFESSSKPGTNNVMAEEIRKKPLFEVHGSASTLKASVGKLLFGHLLNRVIVGADKHPVIIVLKSDQRVFSNLRLLGTASQATTPGRVTIDIQKLIFHSGVSHPIVGVAMDRDGALGLSAQVVSGKALSVAGSLASSFVSGLAASQQSTNTNAFGFEATRLTPRNALLGGLAQTAADQSKRLIEESTSEKPVMILEPGTEVTVMLQDEVMF